MIFKRIIAAVACIGAMAVSAGSPANAMPAQPATVAPHDFVLMSSTDPAIHHDIRYFTAHNFVGRRIAGYVEPLCILTKRAATALSAAAREVRRHGYAIKVYDCYRPTRAVADFVAWSEDLTDQRMKAEFYPSLEKSVIFNEGYIANPSSHSRGSTVDLTLVRIPARVQPPYLPGQRLQPCTAPAGQRFPDNSVDMGTGYDCFDSFANTRDPRITGAPMENRLLLDRAMTNAGFKNLDLEWWHYTLNDEPYPNTYFNFPVAKSSL
jgi:D-alanyl-D-alanine dipeptidase